MKSTVTVTVLVEVETFGVWSDACTIGQMKTQAKEEVVQKLAKALERLDAKIITTNTISILSKEA